MKFRQKTVFKPEYRKGKCNVWKTKLAPTEDTDFNTGAKNSRHKVFEVNMKSVHASCYFQRTFQLLPCVARERSRNGGPIKTGTDGLNFDQSKMLFPVI